MKSKIFICATVLLLITATSCDKDFLNQVPDDRLTIKDIFINLNNTESALANIYANVPDEFGQRFVTSGSGHGNSGPWTGGSDEAEYIWGFVVSNEMNVGAWNSSSEWVRTLYMRYYQGIRNATYFIDNAHQCKECKEEIIVKYKAEARALRAMFYYYLMRMFGPVIILDDKTIDPDVSIEDVQIPRNSFDECVDYVVAELDAAGSELPITPSQDNQVGRITRGMASAFKQEVLLLAASPLFNGNTDYAELKNKDGKQLISQTYDANKWKRASDAAKEFIDQYVPSVYSLYRNSGTFNAYLSCRDVMTQSWNSEWIFGRPASVVQWRQYETTPYHSGAPSEKRGSGGLGATQTMVDAYFMANGKPISDPSAGYVSSGFTSFRAPFDFQNRVTFNQWVNREPRFYVGITYDGSLWLNRNSGDVITSTQYNGNSGQKIGGNDYSRTGYIVRKNMVNGDWNVGGRALVLLRLAQVYLNYAEALNEHDPGNPNILTYLNLIRDRAGIPLFGTASLPAPASQDEMRLAIQRERRVELAFENVRFFDVRRWKIAEQTDNGPAQGLNISKDAPEFYNTVTFENRVFQKRHYLFPLPQRELNINKQLIQNTGW